MILGQGIDIVEVSRIEKVFNKFGNKFVDKFLSTEEKLLIPKEEGKIIHFLAKYWAVKEATSKAVGCGLVNGSLLCFKDIVLDVEKEEPFTGRPTIRRTNRLFDVVVKMYNLSNAEREKIVFHISTSGDGKYLIASAILELRN